MRDSGRRKKAPKRETAAGDNSRADKGRRIRAILICFFLVTIVWIVFGQTLGHEFVNYDDPDYVYENARITSGLTLDGIVWAFTHVHSSNWHPLTTISHMLDCSIYGLQPWGHHLTNVLLHSAAVLLLYFALSELTGMEWPSAVVAALFAIHPLRVESVAWISERKDVLSGVFFMLVLWTYARYVRSYRPSPGRYLLIVVFFALGLMCKPTVVTLPFVLLLLDYWPLRRFAFSTETKSAPNRSEQMHRGRSTEKMSPIRPVPTRSIQYLLVEKIPLVVLSVFSCVATMIAQEKTISTIRQITLGDRIGNAMISYVVYIGKMFWPANLAVFYPYREEGITITEPMVAFIILLIISVAAFIGRHRYPYLSVGWLWFVGMLVPMIGIIQVGGQSRADRYTYLPQIGLYLLITWGVIELFGKWERGRQALGIVAGVVIVALTACGYVQASSWKDSETLWQQALAHTSNNYLAHNNLGGTLIKKGQLDEAIFHSQKALEIHPGYADAYTNLGHALASKHNWAEAIPSYEAAIQARPNYAKAHNFLGVSLAALGKTDDAIRELREAVRLNGDYVDAHYNLATLLLRLDQRDEAVIELRELLRLRPGDMNARAQLRKLGVEQ